MVAGASVQARARSSNTTRQPARPSAIVRSVSSANVSVDRPPTCSSAFRRNEPPAPGTVMIEPVTSCTRRSMLKPTTYSMCCIRPMSSSRFAILTLPATAPIVGSANGWASRRTVSGSNTVSPSIMMMISWLGGPDAHVERLGLAASSSAAAPARSGSGEGLHEIGGAIAGPVVDDQHFERVVVGHDGPDRRLDVLDLVVGGHDHGDGLVDRWTPAEVLASSALRVAAGVDHHQHEPHADEHADDDQQVAQAATRSGWPR